MPVANHPLWGGDWGKSALDRSHQTPAVDAIVVERGADSVHETASIGDIPGGRLEPFDPRCEEAVQALHPEFADILRCHRGERHRQMHCFGIDRERDHKRAIRSLKAIATLDFILLLDGQAIPRKLAQEFVDMPHASTLAIDCQSQQLASRSRAESVRVVHHQCPWHTRLHRTAPRCIVDCPRIDSRTVQTLQLNARTAQAVTQHARAE